MYKISISTASSSSITLVKYLPNEAVNWKEKNIIVFYIFKAKNAAVHCAVCHERHSVITQKNSTGYWCLKRRDSGESYGISRHFFPAVQLTPSTVRWWAYFLVWKVIWSMPAPGPSPARPVTRTTRSPWSWKKDISYSTEEKAKIVAAAWGIEFIQFLDEE